MTPGADLVPAREPDGNDRLNALTNSWLAGRKSDHTRQAYRLDLESWLRWCAANGTHPTEAWPGDVLRWLASLDGEAGATRARRLSAVSSWYKWLIRHQAMARNPAVLDRAERPVAAPRRAPALSDAQAEKLLAAAAADPNLRTAAIIYLLLTTGIRVGELIAANVGDIGLDQGVTVLQVRGKGGRGRPVEIEPHTLARIDAYLAGRSDVQRLPTLPGQPGAGDRPLIATKNGRRVDRWMVRQLLLRLARAAGLPQRLVDQLTPHSTRATQITASLEAGLTLRDVQRNAGHASPNTTLVYDRSHWTPDRSPSRAVARRWRVERIDRATEDGQEAP